MKGNAVTNAITIVGIGVIGALMFAQVPDMMENIKSVLSKTSAIVKSAELADMLILSTSSPGDIKISYKLPPEVSYTVFIKNGIVNVSTEKEWASSKTISPLCFWKDPTDNECKPSAVKKLVITKTSIEKVE